MSVNYKDARMPCLPKSIQMQIFEKLVSGEEEVITKMKKTERKKTFL